MKKEKCIACREYKNCKDSFASTLFFIIGLIATVAIRVVTVLADLRPLYGKVAWYIGVGGFFLFFIYKYRVNQARLKLITQKNIMEKINKQEQFSKDDYSLIGTVLCGISSKQERFNYLFIFILSGVALIWAIYIDFF